MAQKKFEEAEVLKKKVSESAGRIEELSVEEKEVEEKINDNVEVTKQDLIALTFTPIMSGKLSKLDKIIKSIRLVKKIDNEYRYEKSSYKLSESNRNCKRGADL